MLCIVLLCDVCGYHVCVRLLCVWLLCVLWMVLCCPCGCGVAARVVCYADVVVCGGCMHSSVWDCVVLFDCSAGGGSSCYMLRCAVTLLCGCVTLLLFVLWG